MNPHPGSEPAFAMTNMESNPGISTRLLVASQLMAGMLANPKMAEAMSRRDFVEDATDFADALIAAAGSGAGVRDATPHPLAKSAHELATLIVRDVCEIPGRFSPEVDPDLIQFSADELRAIVENRLEVEMEGAGAREGGDELARMTRERNDLLDGVHAMLVAAGAPEDIDEMEKALQADAGTKPSHYVRNRFAELTAQRDRYREGLDAVMRGSSLLKAHRAASAALSGVGAREDAATPQPADDPALSYDDAIAMAESCHDMNGGYGGGDQWKAFHHGIDTVIAVLKGRGSNSALDVQPSRLDRVTAQRDRYREALANLYTKLKRTLDDGGRGGPIWWLPDHACVECVPNGDILVEGFLCAEHAASAALNPPPSAEEASDGN